jgi:DNA-binding transcriptional regulator YiaG
MTPMQQRVAEEIRRLRTFEFTYGEIARAVGSSVDSVRRWEKGETRPQRPQDVIKKLQKML